MTSITYRYKIIVLSFIILILAIGYVYAEKNYEYAFANYMAFAITNQSNNIRLERYSNNGIKMGRFDDEYEGTDDIKQIEKVITYEELIELCNNMNIGETHLERIKKLPRNNNYAIGVTVIGSDWTGDLKVDNIKIDRLSKMLKVNTEIYTEKNEFNNNHTYGIFIVPIIGYSEYSVQLSSLYN